MLQLDSQRNEGVPPSKVKHALHTIHPVKRQSSMLTLQRPTEIVHPFTTDNPCNRVAIDAEWYQPVANKTSIFTQKQVTYYDNDYQPCYTVVLLHPELPMPTDVPDKVEVKYHPALSPTSTPLEDMGVPLAKEVTVMMYYSPKDPEAVLGRDNFRAALLEPGVITKKRNLTGCPKIHERKYKIKDLYGMFSSSLDSALKSVGIDNPHKSLVEDSGYTKDDMWTWAKERPNEALKYAVGDTMHIGELYKRKVDQTNTIITEALGIPQLFTYDNFPGSSGALVAKTYEGFLMHKYPRLYSCVMLLSDSIDDKSWYILKNVVSTVLDADTDTLSELNRKVRGNDQIIHGLGMGSIRNYAIIAPQCGLTAFYNAVVQGARCINEEPHINPYHNKLKNVYDPDNSSCYGSALSKFDMPFGIPELVGFDKDDTPLKLGDFMDKYSSQLVPNLYQIIVSGPMTKGQDLIHSKCDLSTSKIMSTLLGGNFSEDDASTGEGHREIAVAHVGGSFELNTHEITLGVITHDVWNTLKAVSTNAEMKDIRNLTVNCVAGYRKDDEVSVDEWCDIMEDPKSRGKKSRGKDSRTHKWCRLPLSEFVGRFVEYRKRTQKLPGGKTKGEYNYLLQTAVKLFVNTTYGCLASPYFPMGNTVLANNITARARVGGWMLSKALLLNQLITDGGLGSGDRIAVLVGKKPSLAVLADRTRLLSHRSIKIQPLMIDKCGKSIQLRDWLLEDQSTYKERCDILDKRVNEVVREFWSHWDLEPLFDVECKYEHTGRRAVYFGNADYLIHDIVQGEFDKTRGETTKGYDILPADQTTKLLSLVKCRGARKLDHPKKRWLMHLLDSSSYSCPEPDYIYTELLGVSEFQANPHDELMPGDSITKSTVHTPYRSGFLAPTHADRLKDDDTHRKQSTRFKKTRQYGDRYGYANQVALGKLTPFITPSSFKSKRVITNT